jgi:predicted transcriptional regulator
MLESSKRNAMRKRTMPKRNTKRTPIELFAEILDLCKQPTAKTQVMYKTNLSYPNVVKLLEHLQELQMLKLDKNSKKYETTEKGRVYVKKYYELEKILRP